MNTGKIEADRLKSYIERIERLNEEKSNITEDTKEVFNEAKMHGYDVKIMREIIKLRKMEASDLEEKDFLLETYKRALGMSPQPDMFEDEIEDPANTKAA